MRPREVYGTAGMAVGGVFAPRGRAVAVAGDLEVTGRWAFASGSPFCDWLMGGCLTELDGRRARAPARALPARGRGDPRHLDGVRAPRHGQPRHRRGRTARAGGALGGGDRRRARGWPGALYAFPLFGLLAAAIAGVTLGIARGAMDDLLELAGAKTPEGSRRTLAERSTVQSEVARAEAALRAARGLLVDALERGYAARRGAATGIDTDAAAGACAWPPRTPRAAPRAWWTPATSSAGAARSTPRARCSAAFATCTRPRSTCWFRRPRSSSPGRLLLGLPTDTSQL